MAIEITKVYREHFSKDADGRVTFDYSNYTLTE